MSGQKVYDVLKASGLTGSINDMEYAFWAQGGGGSGGGGGTAITALPSTNAFTNSAVDGIPVVVNGVAYLITIDKFLAAAGVGLTSLPVATSAASTDMLLINQGGVDKQISVANLGATGTGGSTGGGTTPPPTGGSGTSAYTVTGYSGNTTKNVSFSGASSYNGSKYLGPGAPFTDNYGYFNIADSGGAAPTADVYAGWSMSNTTPPSTTVAKGSVNVGVNAGNAFVCMDHPGAFAMVGYIWAAAGANGNYYLWFKIGTEAAFCWNPNSPVVVSGA